MGRSFSNGKACFSVYDKLYCVQLLAASCCAACEIFAKFCIVLRVLCAVYGINVDVTDGDGGQGGDGKVCAQPCIGLRSSLWKILSTFYTISS